MGFRGPGFDRGSGFDGSGLGRNILEQRGRSCCIRVLGELGVREGELVVQGLGARGEALGGLGFLDGELGVSVSGFLSGSSASGAGRQ